MSTHVGAGPTSVDLVVAGGGVAGIACAIAAADLGLSVLLAEKTGELGGACRWSGGNLVDLGPETGLAHLRALCFDKTDDDVLEAYIAGLHDLPGWLEGLGAALVTQPQTGPGAVEQCWPYAPGADEVVYYRVAGGQAGAALLDVLRSAIERRPRIEVLYDAPMTRLLTDDSDRVIGGELGGDEPRAVYAAAVALTTGGIENAPHLCDAYLPVTPTFALAQAANTGDGLRLSQSVGAAVWHMSNFFGYWAMRAPGQPMPYAIRVADPGHLLVDGRGHRFAAETGREVHDVLRVLGSTLPKGPHLPGMPAYAVFDQAALDAGPLSRMPTPNPRRWSPDNSAELAEGWIVGCGDAAELARRLGIDAASLTSTLERYNQAARSGRDEAFGRAAATMRALDLTRLYAVELWPGIATTSAGPRRDPAARVVDWSGEPIPGLVAAGGNGSVWGHLTQHGGGLTDGLVFGRIAAVTVAAEISSRA